MIPACLQKWFAAGPNGRAVPVDPVKSDYERWLDEALAIRKAGRAKRSEASRKGWQTRRAG